MGFEKIRAPVMRPISLVLLLAALSGAGCGSTRVRTVTEIQQATTTTTVVTTATERTQLPPNPDPGGGVIACLDFKCVQDGHAVDFGSGGSYNAPRLGDICGQNGTWVDVGTDPKTTAGLYRCKQGPPP